MQLSFGRLHNPSLTPDCCPGGIWRESLLPRVRQEVGAIEPILLPLLVGALGFNWMSAPPQTEMLVRLVCGFTEQLLLEAKVRPGHQETLTERDEALYVKDVTWIQVMKLNPVEEQQNSRRKAPLYGRGKQNPHKRVGSRLALLDRRPPVGVLSRRQHPLSGKGLQPLLQHHRRQPFARFCSGCGDGPLPTYVVHQ